MSKTSNLNNYLFYILFLVAISLLSFKNIDFVNQFSNQPAVYNLEIDTEKYHNIALNLLEDKEFNFPISQPPVYSIFLSSIYKFFGVNYLTPKIIFCFLLTLSSIFIFAICNSYINKYVAFIASILLIYSPATTAYCATIQYEIFVLFLLSVSFYFYFKSLNTENQKRKSIFLIITAISFSTLTLTREVFAVLFPLIILIFYRRFEFKQILVSLLVFVTPIMSWIIWQYFSHGELVFISNKGQLNLIIGFNPNANGTFNSTLLPPVEPKGIEFILSHPLKAFELFIRKQMYFLGYLKDGWNVPYSLSLIFNKFFWGFSSLNFSQFLARAWFSTFSLIGAFILIYKNKFKDIGYIIILSTIIISFLHGIFISSSRFAIPLYPLWAVSSGYFIYIIFKELLKSKILLFIFLSYFLISQIFAPVGNFNIIASNLDGIIGENVRIPETGKKFRYAKAVNGKRSFAIITDEYYPKGIIYIEFDWKTINDKFNETLHTFLINENGNKLCEKYFKNSLNSKNIIVCYINKKRPVKIIFETLGKTDIYLGDINISFNEKALAKINSRKYVNKETTLIDFEEIDEEQSLLLSGFGGAEKWASNRTIKWALGNESNLMIQLRENQNYKLKIKLSPFLPDKNTKQKLSLLINKKVFFKDFINPGWQEVSVNIPKKYINTGFNLLTLKHSKSFRPKDFGKGNDSRKLSVAYDMIEIVKY